MKKRSLTAGLALALTLSLTPVQAANTTYLDVDRSVWYSTPVAFCQQHLLMDGVSYDSFQPDEPLTKAVLAEALYRMNAFLLEAEKEEDPLEEAQEEDVQEGDVPEKDVQQEAPSFTDVGPDHPNFAAIRWAREAGVVSGYPDGTFHPDAPVTRQEIAVLLWNGRQQPEDAPEAPYPDREDIGEWARPAVDWAYEAKIMTGDGTFRPQSVTTRAEGAAIVMNYAQAYCGMTYGYAMPEAVPLRENTYVDELYQLDEETGYLSYLGKDYIRGIDVSAYQGEIDWSRVAASGVRFAMMRSGYRGYGWGAIQKDPYFNANMRGALSNGIEVGVYFFSQALTPAEAEEEARLVLDWIRGYDVTYPIVFDWEEQDYNDSRTQNCDGNTVTACALAFCKVIEDAGYLPMTYSSPKRVYEGDLHLEYLQNYPFWLANYTDGLTPTTFRYHYDMWQYTSHGHVDGIDGRVDLNICFVTDWSAWNEADSGPGDSETEDGKTEDSETPSRKPSSGGLFKSRRRA